ncbi:MAG: DUF4097 family beta strand repeat-containing protein [Candidatus Thermoplasmatota archaeon]|nr:DUF4097 family beta strand repeat-containing protein [Candidatus Thermoplasmatota archaeon]
MTHMTSKRGVISALVCLALLTIAFSGCISDVANSVAGIGERPWESAESQKSGYGTKSTPHGEPSVDESDVDYTFRGANYLPPFAAKKTITITNGFGSARDCALASNNCEIHIQTWNESGYKFVATLEAGGFTPYEAESNLEKIQVKNTDSLSDGVLSIGIEAEYGGSSQLIGLGYYESVNVEAYVPSWASYELYAGASGGDVSIEGISGTRLSVETSGGDVSVRDVVGSRLSIETSGGDVLVKNSASQQIRFKTSGGDITMDGLECEDASIQTSGGDISGEIIADRLDMETSGGGIEVKIGSVEYGSYDVSTSGGDVSIYVKNGEKYGYDVRAKSSSGQITIRLSDSENLGDYEDEDEAHYRTQDYESKDVQVKMNIKTSGGDIFVSD